MSAAQELNIKRLPLLAPLLLRAALPRKTAEPLVFPQRSITLGPLQCSRGQVKRYASACGFAVNRDTLPPSYLHNLAFRLQMQLMVQSDFPLSPMGSVHLSNTITQQRGIAIDESLRLECRLSEHELTERGVEFVFECRAYAGDDCVWEDSSRYLSRRKTGIAKRAKAARKAPRQFSREQALAISPAAARRYARASGDFNPIHLHDISAKLLGFKKMVIHGMWSKAACIAKLIDHESSNQLRCKVEFKTPVFLPAQTLLCYDNSAEGVDFELRDAHSGKPHLIGEISHGNH